MRKLVKITGDYLLFPIRAEKRGRLYLSVMERIKFINF